MERALLGAVAIVLVVGLIGAFTVDSGDDASASVAARGQTTTTDQAAIDESPAIGDVSATTTTVLVKSTTTKPAAPTTTIASKDVADPGPMKPPAVGTYTYKFVYADDPSKNANITQQYEAQPDQNGAVRRKETYPDGQGNKLTNDVSYGADGVRIHASHIVATQATIDCAWSPPILVFLVPLSIGKTWGYESSCTTSASGAQVTVKRKGDDKVTGKALDIVGNTSVRTWVIEEHVVTTVTSAFGPTSRDAVVTRHWSPDYGLITFEKESGTTNGQKYLTERTLQDVKPK